MMDGLQIKEAEYKYTDPDGSLTEQFIDRLNDNGRIDGMLIEVTTLENIKEAQVSAF